MIILEIPLWLLICFVVLFSLTVVHLAIGDLIANIIIKLLKEKGDSKDGNKIL